MRRLSLWNALRRRLLVRDGRALNATCVRLIHNCESDSAELGMTISKASISIATLARYETEPLVKISLICREGAEGMPRHSTHAAGIVISKMPLDECSATYMS